jgi:hypothetical protein
MTLFESIILSYSIKRGIFRSLIPSYTIKMGIFGSLIGSYRIKIGHILIDNNQLKSVIRLLPNVDKMIQCVKHNWMQNDWRSDFFSYSPSLPITSNKGKIMGKCRITGPVSSNRSPPLLAIIIFIVTVSWGQSGSFTHLNCGFPTPSWSARQRPGTSKRITGETNHKQPQT